MPAIETLVDGFITDQLVRLWPGSYGSFAVGGGRAAIACNTGFNAIRSDDIYTPAGSALYAELTPPAASTATEAYVEMKIESTTPGTEIVISIDAVSGLVRCSNSVSYFDAGATTETYSPGLHRFVRISESGGTLRWERSANRSTWVVMRSLATPAWFASITTATVLIQAHRDAGTNDSAYADNVNATGRPEYQQLIDWNGDGEFGDAPDDVTARVLDGRTAVTTRVGRDQARALSPSAAGSGMFELNNLSRDYSSENPSSPLADDLQPGRRTLLRAGLDGETFPILAGYIDDWETKPSPSERSVGMSVLDAIGYLREVQVSTALHSGIRTGTAIGLLLDAAGWPADMRDIDPGVTVMPWWWVDEVQVSTALADLADSEGPSALLTVDGTGRIVFRDRHHRLMRNASRVVQSQWASSGAEPLFSAPATYAHGWKEIVNAINFETPQRRRAPVTSVVWSTEERITIAAGDAVSIVARSSGAFMDAITPRSGTDFTATGTAVTVTLSRRSGQSTVITIASPGGNVIIDGLRLRAVALTTVDTVTVQARDSTSIAAYGQRTPSELRPPVWANAYDAAAIGALILGQRAQRRAQVTVTFVGANVERLTEMLTRDLSDRVHVIEDHTGLDEDCYIEQISHSISQGGREHRTTFGLETIAALPDPVFTFNLAGAGFNDGQFAPTGYDDPDTMIIFDRSGQGFDQGVFAN